MMMQQNGINRQQFQQWLPQINSNILAQLATQARQQGVPEKEIQAGMEFINKLKNNKEVSL